MYFLKFVWFLLFILSASAVRIRTLQSPVHISDFRRKPEPGQHCFFQFLTWNVFIINCFLTEKELRTVKRKKMLGTRIQTSDDSLSESALYHTVLLCIVYLDKEKYYM